MSKIKNLIDKMNNSSIFSPKLAARTKKRGSKRTPSSKGKKPTPKKETKLKVEYRTDSINSVDKAMKEIEKIKTSINTKALSDELKSKYINALNEMLNDIYIKNQRWGKIKAEVINIVLAAKEIEREAEDIANPPPKEVEMVTDEDIIIEEEEVKDVNLNFDTEESIYIIKTFYKDNYENFIRDFTYNFKMDGRYVVDNIITNNEQIALSISNKVKEEYEKFRFYKDLNKNIIKRTENEIYEIIIKNWIYDNLHIVFEEYHSILRIILKNVLSNFIELKSSCNMTEENRKNSILLKMKLLEAEEFIPSDLYNVCLDYITKEDIEELYDNNLSAVSNVIREYERNRGSIYSYKQLATTYNKIIDSFVIKGITRTRKTTKSDVEPIIKYLVYIKDNPLDALKTLLWIDTFHDFKGGEEGRAKINKIDNKTFLEYYRDSFFTPTKGFKEEYKNTVLKDVNINPELLYNVSTIVIENDDGFERDLFWAYILVCFNFNLDGTTKSMLEDLKNIFWSQIDKDLVEYYAKDVDEGSGNMIRGNLVIIPASIFDANPSNSSKIASEFVNIPKTVIPFAYHNNYEYTYNYTEGDEKSTATQEAVCNLTINYNDFTFANSCKAASYKIEKTATDEGLLKIFFTPKGDPNIPQNIKGMSVSLIGRIINALANVKYKGKEIPCDVLDFWVSLKRIGDYGQILQCKQLGIPLFTTDSMQLLISIAIKSSVIWTPDYSKVLWYDGITDSLRCSNPILYKYTCSISRKDKQTVDINDILKQQGIEVLPHADKLLQESRKRDNEEIILKSLKPIPNLREYKSKF